MTNHVGRHDVTMKLFSRTCRQGGARQVHTGSCCDGPKPHIVKLSCEVQIRMLGISPRIATDWRVVV